MTNEAERASDGSDEIVTCICLTTARRQQFWPRIFDCFRQQTHPFKQLVFVYEGGGMPEMANDPEVTIVELEEDINVGRKRNIALGHANGKWIVHFDDDDLYAPNYIEAMLQELWSSKAQCVKLVDFRVFDTQRNLWAEYRGLRPLPGRFSTQGALRALSHGFGLMYARDLLERFPFHEGELRSKGAAEALDTEAERMLQCKLAAAKAARGDSAWSVNKGEADEDNSENEDGDERGNEDDEEASRNLQRQLKNKQKNGCPFSDPKDIRVPFLEEPEDREFMMRLLEAKIYIHLVQGLNLAVHVQHGSNIFGMVVHEMTRSPSESIASTPLAEVVPAWWLDGIAPVAPLQPPEEIRATALWAWGLAGNHTLLAGELSDNMVQMSAFEGKMNSVVVERPRMTSLRILDLQCQVVDAEKEAGNCKFKAGELEEATVHYQAAIAVAGFVSLFASDVSPPIREKNDIVHYALLCNLALVAMKRCNAAEAETYASNAIPLDRGNFKAWWRRARARQALGHEHDAAQDLVAAWKRAPEKTKERDEIGRELALAKKRGLLAKQPQEG